MGGEGDAQGGGSVENFRGWAYSGAGGNCGLLFVGQMEDARLDEKTKNNSIRIPAILIRGVDIMPSLASFTRV